MAGFSPLVATWLLGVNGDEPWLVAALFVGLWLNLAGRVPVLTRKSEAVDMEEINPVQDTIVAAEPVRLQ